MSEPISDATRKFMADVTTVMSNPFSSDGDISRLLEGYLSSGDSNDYAINYFTTMLNQRSQRATALSNIEEKRHQTNMSIISNIK